MRRIPPLDRMGQSIPGSITYDALGEVSTETTSDGAGFTPTTPTASSRTVFTSNNTAVLPSQDLQYNYDAVGIAPTPSSTGDNEVHGEQPQRGTPQSARPPTPTMPTQPEEQDRWRSDYDLHLRRPEPAGRGLSASGTVCVRVRLRWATSPPRKRSNARLLQRPDRVRQHYGLGTLVGRFANSAASHDVTGSDSSADRRFWERGLLRFRSAWIDGGDHECGGNYVNRYSYRPLARLRHCGWLAECIDIRGAVRSTGDFWAAHGLRAYDSATAQF